MNELIERQETRGVNARFSIDVMRKMVTTDDDFPIKQQKTLKRTDLAAIKVDYKGHKRRKIMDRSCFHDTQLRV